MHIRSKSVLVCALTAGLLFALAACGGIVEDPPCSGVAGCEPDPLPSPPGPSPTTPAPAPDNGGTEPPREPASTTPPAPRADELTWASCPAPYHGKTNDGRCVWSCSEGTTPDPAGGIECVCKPGTSEVDTDRFGRRVCR